MDCRRRHLRRITLRLGHIGIRRGRISHLRELKDRRKNICPPLRRILQAISDSREKKEGRKQRQEHGVQSKNGCNASSDDSTTSQACRSWPSFENAAVKIAQKAIRAEKERVRWQKRHFKAETVVQKIIIVQIVEVEVVKDDLKIPIVATKWERKTNKKTIREVKRSLIAHEQRAKGLLIWPEDQIIKIAIGKTKKRKGYHR